MLITPDVIAAAISAAPSWAKIGLTMPSQRLREDAHLEVARHVYSALYHPVNTDTGQLPLPL